MKLKILKEKDYDLYLEYIKRLTYCINCDFKCLGDYYKQICQNIKIDSKEEDELVKKFNMNKNRK
jgi:hypothetical protein